MCYVLGAPRHLVLALLLCQRYNLISCIELHGEKGLNSHRADVKCPSRASAGGRIHIRGSLRPLFRPLVGVILYFFVTKTTFCLLLLFDSPDKPQQLDNTHTHGAWVFIRRIIQYNCLP